MKYLHPHYINLIKTRMLCFVSTLVCRCRARWWNVSLGRGSRFYGCSVFRSLPESTISIGRNVIFNSSHTSNLIGIHTPCMISTIQRKASITIGNNCGFSGTVIGCGKEIIIGDNVRCGANTLITDSDWHRDDRRSKPDAPVVIEDGVWLGYGVKVLKGVHIGRNSLIGACSVVTSDIPANVIAAGNPCRVIRIIE